MYNQSSSLPVSATCWFFLPDPNKRGRVLSVIDYILHEKHHEAGEKKSFS